MNINVPFDPQIFYSRQIVLQELGLKGQQKLKQSKVAVAGVGGLGSVSALYLALAGVGFLRLIDQDTVELHNLHRQVLYSFGNLRYPKVEAAAQRIKSLNPEVEVEPIPENIRADNVEELINGVDVVVDGLDNMRTRYLINRVCAEHGIPYVFGAAIGMEGNLSVFAPPETPCLECVLPNIEDDQLPTCDVRGVLGSTTGIIGALQAMETIKLLANINETLKGRLLVCDFTTMDFVKLDIYKSPDCPVCQGVMVEKPSISERLIWLCGQKTVNINPSRPVLLNLEWIYEKLKNRFKTLLKSSMVLVFECCNGVEVSLFKSGRTLIKNVENEENALKIYRSIMNELDDKFSSAS
ncbi:MAG: HesA/MoeB/ThiF family protein [Candidatus Bathyarchaeota archaeon]|nr:HesA/MoeB/ThiF family protein [Candidatus Bathyarchaeota archaeon]MCX8177677.1 HesA/MoeB/ThiF family protein [Candidatus Bathyarchaeota archaeon]MDW8193931.1 HesA/MoeB/ThiF family protein [Nitrososphaerota archaeon]